VHLEDQVEAKRCGHRPGKRLVTADEMVSRVKAAASGKTDRDFVLMARTDALAVEGLDAALDRAVRYRDAGADMIFAEACTELSHYEAFVRRLGIPVLANVTEFGKTPLFTITELETAGVAMVLYPLSAFRAMNAAAEATYSTIRTDGTQRRAIESMQTREQLYETLNYYAFEQQIERTGSAV
jgi:methylisocitrate lyase